MHAAARRAPPRAAGPVAAALAFAALAAIAAVAVPGDAAAQLGHPMPDLGQALHERLEQADAVAFATVDRVDIGRLHLRDVVPVSGRIAEGAAVKRSPQAPPPFEPGDRGLFLLRGARPPYTFVDRPAEMVAIDGAEDEAAWRAALAALRAASGDPGALLDVYLSWIDGASESRRAAARIALFDAGSPFRPLPPRAVASRVQAAVDPGRPEAARALSAALAVESEAGLDALLELVPAEGAAGDANVTRMAIRTGLARGRPAARDALVRALRHEQHAVRSAALSLATRLEPVPPEIEAELARLEEATAEDG